VFNENKALLNIVKEVEKEESLASQSAQSLGSGTSYTMNFGNEPDLKSQVTELQQRLEAAHTELEKVKRASSRSPTRSPMRSPVREATPVKSPVREVRTITSNVCPKCSGGLEVEEAQIRELLEDKERDVATCESRIDTLKSQVAELELRMRSTHHGPGSSMVALSKETYALKRQQRICEARLEELWKEREEASLELRKLSTDYTKPAVGKYGKADVIAELKSKMNSGKASGGSSVQDSALSKENSELKGHVTEMMEYIDQQEKSLAELKLVAQDKEDLEQQLEELSQFLDNQVPDNDVEASVSSAVDAAVSAVREQYESALAALQTQTSSLAEQDKETYNKLRDQVAECLDEGENMAKFRTNATRDNLKKQSVRLKAVLDTLDAFVEQKEVEDGTVSQKEPSLLQILILGSGDVKVKCSGGSSSAVVVQQVQGCPEDEAERAAWCRDLEAAVEIIKEGGGRTESLRSSRASLSDERILLKLVLQLPPAFQYSIKLD